MDEATKAMASAIHEAMRAEAEGHSFYLMAAQVTADEQGREVFEQLAREELEHLHFLKKQHQALLETGKANPEIRLGKRAEDRPIFSAGIRDRLGEAHFEMTALSVGIQLELQAERFYREQGETATDETVRAFFFELAEWEAGHYQSLLDQQEELKEDYWSQSGFSPF